MVKKERTATRSATVKSNRPWFAGIREELENRDKACQSKYGPINEYVRPNVDPYKYPNVETFKRAYPFSVNGKNCKIIKPVSNDTDMNKRYFENVRHASQCKRLGGIWQEGDINRKNKYDQGVCWTNRDDAYCGTQYQVPSLLRPQDVKNKNLEGVIKKTEFECSSDAKCQWKKTGKFSYDCFSKKSVREKTSSAVPPSDMPKDVTRGNIEKYMYDWYAKGIPSKAPDTNELFGTGNRCTHQATSSVHSEMISNDPYLRKIERIKMNIRSLDPKRRADLDELSKFMSDSALKQFRKDFQEAKNLNQLTDAHKEELYKKYIPDYFSDKIVEHLRSIQDASEDEGPSALLPSVPQSVVNMTMKHIAILGKDTTNRGMLAWHSTGSGKTCTATGVIDAFWDDEDREIIFASSLDAIASNPDYKFHECAMNLYPRFQSEPFLGETKEETMANIGAAFSRRGVRFLSFAKLSNRVRKTLEYMRGGAAKKKKAAKPRAEKKAAKPRAEKKVTKPRAKPRAEKKVAKKPRAKTTVKTIKTVKTVTTTKTTETPVKTRVERVKLRAERPVRAVQEHKLSKDEFVDLNKTILIIDEVHNLFRPLATQRQQHEYLEKQLLDPKKFPNLKIVILTATPGDNIPDVIKLLNIVRDPSHAPIVAPNIDDEAEVKHFKRSIRGLISFFDMSSDLTKFPEVVDEAPIKYPMSMAQFNRYVEAYNDVKAESRDFDKLAKLNQANKYWAAPRRYANTLFNFDKDMSLSDFSSKMPALLENIQAEPDAKHYVYSAFFENRGYGGHGIIAVAKELDKLGYTKLTVKDAKKLNATGTLPDKRKRYVLAITNEIGDEGSSSAGKNLHELIKIYNSRENKNGDFIHVFLASQGFNEGIDLKGVRHIHIFEPLVTWASDKQTLGRAARYCSHADLDRDKGEWKVRIHRYMSDMPLELKRPSFNNDATRERQILARLELLNNDLSMLDSKTQKLEINDIKAEISSLKNEFKSIEKEVKQKKKLDLENLQNIEEVIFQESRDRMKQLLIVYQAMKEAAVDCRILQKFHGATGNQIKCEPYESTSPMQIKVSARPKEVFNPFFK